MDACILIFDSGSRFYVPYLLYCLLLVTRISPSWNLPPCFRVNPSPRPHNNQEVLLPVKSCRHPIVQIIMRAPRPACSSNSNTRHYFSNSCSNYSTNTTSSSSFPCRCHLSSSRKYQCLRHRLFPPIKVTTVWEEEDRMHMHHRHRQPLL